jgi:predicted O-linked N-acetylglucosamine transferase (SPINDLY family)
LKLYHRIDIALDTFPYNGHTTSLDALWMGVPVITLVGSTVVGRAGLSQLTNLQLLDLVAYTTDQFVECAVQLTSNPLKLQELRSTLRQRMEKSPLMDGQRFAANMAKAYRQMWGAWCDKKIAG